MSDGRAAFEATLSIIIVWHGDFDLTVEKPKSQPSYAARLPRSSPWLSH